MTPRLPQHIQLYSNLVYMFLGTKMGPTRRADLQMQQQWRSSPAISSNSKVSRCAQMAGCRLPLLKTDAYHCKCCPPIVL
jgi:hypothetical protein